LGQDKAIKLYEQVARDYSDQREQATTARAKLAVLRQADRPTAPPTMTQRKIELEEVVYPWQPLVHTTNGRQAIYYDAAAGGLVIRDLAGTNKRVIRKGSVDELARWVPSRDFSMVLVASFPWAPKRTAAVMKTDGTGYHELPYLNSEAIDWSWDNRYLVTGGPSGRLAVTSVADGKIRDVLQAKSVVRYAVRFSPDGRYIAFTEGLGPDESRILVVPAQGGEPRVVAEHSGLLDWTLDGRFLAIEAAESDSKALYLVPVKDGSLAGQPVFVRYGAFQSREGRTTAAGGLIYSSARLEEAAFIGDVDATGHVAGWKPLAIAQGQAFQLSIDWSLDGSQVAYVASNNAAGVAGSAVRLQNLATGEEREIYRTQNPGRLRCVSARQHPKLFCTSTGQDTQVFSVALDSGHVEVLERSGQSGRISGVSTDDRTLYFTTGTRPQQWDIGTDQKVFLGDIGASRSADGRWWFGRSGGAVEIRPVSGGPWTRLPFSIVFAGVPAVTSDGKWVLYPGRDSSGKPGLFRIPSTGDQPERSCIRSGPAQMAARSSLRATFMLHANSGSWRISSRRDVRTTSWANAHRRGRSRRSVRPEGQPGV
jgi:Tol biopolymer transport system component